MANPHVLLNREKLKNVIVACDSGMNVLIIILHIFHCITYGLLDTVLVEILCNIGHLVANKDGTFCRCTHIC